MTLFRRYRIAKLQTQYVIKVRRFTSFLPIWQRLSRGGYINRAQAEEVLSKLS